jgi:lysozyme family protein
MNVHTYIEALIEREGGFVDHPNDRGGPTMYGITEAVARAFGYEGPMADMPQGVAKRIYFTRYWLQPRLDHVNEWSQAVAEELLDTGVNMGTETAGKFLQRALNVLNRQGKTYPDVGVDGSIGAMTLAALKAHLKARGAEGETTLLKMLNALQSVRYIEIAENRPSQEDFVYGWQTHRVGAL